VKEAQLLGIPVPFNQAVTDLVKAIEKSFETRSTKSE